MSSIKTYVAHYSAKTSYVLQLQPILSYIFFGLDFHFYVIFLIIGIGQLHNDVKKSAHPKIQFIQPHKEHH